jgi:hypothetical protein
VEVCRVSSRAFTASASIYTTGRRSQRNAPSFGDQVVALFSPLTPASERKELQA